jgi:pimeloyl-ACP methyl ester carboxylesterase
LYTAEGADYFCELIPHAEKIIFDDCGHFMAIDKAEETAESIVNFFERHCNYKETLLTTVEFD